MAELKTILIKGMEEHFQKECSEIGQRLDDIKTLLNKIAESGSLTLPLTIIGMETHFPEYERDLALLEKCGLVESRVKFTERNSYRVYTLSNEGSALIKDLS